ncbi:MAG: UDP-N-acetylmuramoyl-tripeptide--D-alanyl-D-alanine ligase [Lactobacillales bacterium]|nr:UDP-N-acetylmuramoyl-tripeptide--D-alanyl-D-alanine ligase [Lactobacillales bacterium]
MNLSLLEIAKAVHAENNISKSFANQKITGVEFDSRKIKAGNLFIPLNGQRNGHEFARLAQENGAIATLWSEKSTQAPSGMVYFQVKNTLLAMQQLASYFLAKIKPITIAITGSNGKTSTKDLTASVLSTTYKTYKTQGNYNNEIGLPYTILSMPDFTETLVLEMGMDHPKDLRLLSMIAKPDITAITMIGESHLENFGTRKKIAKGKIEIIDGLKPQGELIIPSDEPLLELFTKNVSQKITTFGFTHSSDFQAQIIQEAKNYTSFSLNFLEGEFHLPLSGSFYVKNALIAAYIGRKLDVATFNIKKGLEEVQLTPNRTEWLTRADGAEILSDVYNANPTAMNLILEYFRVLPTSGKRIIILGDMLELGKKSKEFHQELASLINPETIQTVILYGEEMKNLAKILWEKYPQTKVFHFSKNEKQELIDEAKKQIHPHDMVLLKASNGMKLSEVVSALIEHDRL